GSGGDPATKPDRNRQGGSYGTPSVRTSCRSRKTEAGFPPSWRASGTRFQCRAQQSSVRQLREAPPSSRRRRQGFYVEKSAQQQYRNGKSTFHRSILAQHLSGL